MQTGAVVSCTTGMPMTSFLPLLPDIFREVVTATQKAVTINIGACRSPPLRAIYQPF